MMKRKLKPLKIKFNAFTPKQTSEQKYDRMADGYYNEGKLRFKEKKHFKKTNQKSFQLLPRTKSKNRRTGYKMIGEV